MTAGEPHLRDLYQQLKQSWSGETGRHSRPDRPADGQCSVTALVAHDLLGGEIFKTNLNGAWHFYNQIAGRRIDFTAEQFESPIGYDDLPSSREEALEDCTAEQYRQLRAQVVAGT